MLRSTNDMARRNGHSIWLFAGSDKGGDRIANILTIIETVKLHGHNPEVYLTDVMTRIQDHPNDRLEELLPRRWALAKIPQVVIRQA
jgi:hypothetical protein